MDAFPILEKPRVEPNPVIGVTETAGENGRRHNGESAGGENIYNSNDDNNSSSREEQEEAIVALIEHRTKEVEHLRKRVMYYNTQLEQAEKRLHDSESKLARLRRLDNVSSSKNPVDGNKNVKVESDEGSFRSPPQSRPELLIPSGNHGISRTSKVDEQYTRLEDFSTKGSASSGSRASTSASRHPNSNGEAEKVQKVHAVEIQDKRNKRKLGVMDATGEGCFHNTGNSSSGSSPKLVIGFDVEGTNVTNRNELQKVTRDILWSQFSVSINNWKDVSQTTKDDLWSTLKTKFEMDDVHKESVMAMMGSQLKQYRNRIRKKELGNCSAAEIRAKKDHPPNNIPLTHWNEFIEREASESKMLEKEKNAENRGQIANNHCLGKKSYVQLAAELKKQGIEFDRAKLYELARTQTSGEITPSAVGSVTALRQFQATQNEADREDIRIDALSKLCGPDNKGRIRGVSSRMSKKKYLGVQTAKSVLKKACCRAEDAIRAEYDEMFNELNQRLAKLEGSTTSTPTSQSARTMPIGTPTNLNERFDRSRSIDVPSSTSSRMYSIRSVVSSECIAVGIAAATQTLGEKVHGFCLKENETKLNVAMVTQGREDEPIYKEFQGGMSSIGETVGSYIIWPSVLLEPI